MTQSAQEPARFGIVAGNGHFPFLVLEAARERGIDPVIFAIREEASPELDRAAARIHWVGLGEVARLLELLERENVQRLLLAGQVKHAQMFQPVTADPLARAAYDGLAQRNTDALIGAFVRLLEQRGIEVVDSTLFSKPLLAEPGTLTRRAPDATEQADITYGRDIAKQIAALDIGQTVVVADRACVAVEAMEGTDAALERAALLSHGRRLVVVKVSKPGQDMRFDVPVIGPRTIAVMRRSNATTLAIDAGRVLMLERRRLIEDANEAGISIVAE